MKLTNTINEAGGSAYRLSDKSALAQLVCTGCLSNTFYSTDKKQFYKIIELSKKVDSLFIAKLAVFSRKYAYMKETPALLCSILAANKQNDLLAKVFPLVIDNGKMLRNFVKNIRSGILGRKSFGSFCKKLIQNWLNSRDENLLFKDSIGNKPSLSDIIKMVHPKPNSKLRESFYGYLIDKKYDFNELPDIVKSFEDFKNNRSSVLPNIDFRILSSLNLTKENWKEIAKNAQYQMLRMNLNTFNRHGAFDSKEMINIVANKLSNEKDIKNSRQFPYQLLTTYIYSKELPKKISEALHDAMEISIDNCPEFDKDIYILLDISGSMNHEVSRQSKMRFIDIASLFTSVFLRKNNNTHIITFNTDAMEVTFDTKNVLKNSVELSRICHGGTNCRCAMKLLNEYEKNADLVIFISDNQSWNHNNNYGIMVEWTKFKSKNKNAKLINIDISPNTTIQTHESEDVLHIGGFSDYIFEIISLFVNDKLNADYWIGEIEKISL